MHVTTSVKSHTFPGQDAELLETLKRKQGAAEQANLSYNREYKGAPNEILDREITREEVFPAVTSMKKNRSPGDDGITHKMLHKIGDNQIAASTKYLNEELWLKETVPPKWKHSRVILIPKPGKPPSTDNLRPISLTCCLGKVYEHIITNRLIKLHGRQQYVSRQHDWF